MCLAAVDVTNPPLNFIIFPKKKPSHCESRCIADVLPSVCSAIISDFLKILTWWSMLTLSYLHVHISNHGNAEFGRKVCIWCGCGGFASILALLTQDKALKRPASARPKEVCNCLWFTYFDTERRQQFVCCRSQFNITVILLNCRIFIQQVAELLDRFNLFFVAFIDAVLPKPNEVADHSLRNLGHYKVTFWNTASLESFAGEEFWSAE